MLLLKRTDVALAELTEFMDFLRLLRDAATEEAQKIVTKAFMKRSAIQNSLSDRADR